MIAPPVFRTYDADQDRDAVHRIWREVGWTGETEEHKRAIDLHIECGRAFVAEVHGAAECSVVAVPGTVRYLDEELSLSAITAVTTSRVARKQGLASRLTAHAVADVAAAGAQVAGLGIFEQGFYNQLGFGSGGYEHWASFDPARIKVGVRARLPRRVTGDDWAAVHASRLARRRGHGACNLIPPEVTRADMIFTQNGFGLGYWDGQELTHHFWCRAKKPEHGPYTVNWMSYQTPDQFLELMALIRNLGDQVRLVWMREPPDIQLQDMIERPLKQRQMSEKSKYERDIRATAYWQMRICDLAGCMAQTHLRGDAVRFNLSLTDPIESALDEGTPWRGITGDYVVTLGPSSGAEPGTDSSLPTLAASVGAFTRMWLGVRPSSGLAVTDRLYGPPELLEQLDWALRLPEPKPDWDY